MFITLNIVSPQLFTTIMYNDFKPVVGNLLFLNYQGTAI